MERCLSASGKLFLSGEYAVLWGGIARVAAVGERTFALVRRRDDREVHILLGEGRLTGRTTPLGIKWPAEIPKPFAVAARSADTAVSIHGVETTGFDLALSASTTHGGQKLGLGSSARAAVLTTESVRYILEAKFDSLKVALLSHFIAQGNAGSGADVAAVFAGGVIRYREYAVSEIAKSLPRGKSRIALAQAPPVDLWRLPKPSVFLTYVFSGQSSDTRSIIRLVQARLEGEKRASFVRASDQWGEGLERALLRNDFALLRECTRELHGLLASLDLETEPIRQIVALAHSYHAAAKISGAGGGDGCVLFSADPDSRRDLIAGLESRGFFATALNVQIGLQGEPAVPDFMRNWLA